MNTAKQSNYLVSQFWVQPYNSLAIGLMTTVVVGSLGSIALAQIRFRGSRIISSMTLFTYIIPSSFLSIPFALRRLDPLGLRQDRAAFIPPVILY